MARELEVAVAAATAAGEILRSNFGREQVVRYKGEVDVVTEVDEQAERKIGGMLREAFPEYGMLAEEGGAREGGGEHRWIVDPLDGTSNFAHGLPVFCVSIALERAGEVVLGVVHDPMREEIFVAERGGGATLDGRPIRVSETDELIRALLVTGLPYDRDAMPAALDLLSRFAVLTQGLRGLGSAALDVCYVAAGRVDGYYERGVRPWDVAAGALILEEAGGTVTNFRGEKLDLQGLEIVASNTALHPSIVDVTGADPAEDLLGLPAPSFPRRVGPPPAPDPTAPNSTAPKHPS
ncbi:inositol monophosphatase [Rubrobacter marinus]|uniref:Inositol-1-monophosphatase n=1 Tax=Rubrobacter marinus TaxID=2653852 RepID=A0A6G8PWE6_9ACTN|nr:inositol monophosphatase family protein [Rubrobacter marinus]QIN78541.1 inositol monophosphatase [Rubrobacter marinus]